MLKFKNIVMIFALILAVSLHSGWGLDKRPQMGYTPSMISTVNTN